MQGKPPKYSLLLANIQLSFFEDRVGHEDSVSPVYGVPLLSFLKFG